MKESLFRECLSNGNAQNNERENESLKTNITKNRMYEWQKRVVRWMVGDVLYISVPFTWLLKDAEVIAKTHPGQVVVGGPGAMLMKDSIDWGDLRKECEYDTLSFFNPLATFTTRGCPNGCPYCAVPKIEGDLVELKNWKPNPIVCDNNLLAASKKHFEKVIDSIKGFPYVDFNQGLDARLFTGWHAEQLGRLKEVKLRFAFDSMKDEKHVLDAMGLAKRHGFKNINIGIYVLIGFNDTPDEARHRLELIRSHGLRPWPMRFQPLNLVKKNSYVHPDWTEKEIRRFLQYYSHLVWYEHIPFDEFERYSYNENQSMNLFEREQSAI